MTNIIPQIVDQLNRNPHINRIIVSKVEWLLIKREIRKMSRILPSKRPTGNIRNNPWLYSDQELWDMNFKNWRDYTPVNIMGRMVEYRDQSS